MIEVPGARENNRHDGGRVVFTGPPARLAEPDTLTGQHLRAYLG